MVDVSKSIIQIQGKQYRLDRFEVWWSVESLGLFSNISEARDVIGQENVNLINLRPVSVAVSDTPGVYEPI
jgi:hypothetical protein